MTTSFAIEALPPRQVTTLISVSVLGDDAITGRRIAAVLESHGTMVIKSEPRPYEPLRAAAQPDVFVLACDLARPGNLSDLRQLRRVARNARIVAVVKGSNTTGAREALNSGADALILEADLDSALVPVVHAAAAGQVSVPRDLRRCVARPAFSHRERQVLTLVVQGLQNREIADKLFLAESTIKSHLGSSFEKLGVRSRKEAAALVLDPNEGLRALVLDDDLNRRHTP